MCLLCDSRDKTSSWRPGRCKSEMHALPATHVVPTVTWIGSLPDATPSRSISGGSWDLTLWRLKLIYTIRKDLVSYISEATAHVHWKDNPVDVASEGGGGDSHCVPHRNKHTEHMNTSCRKMYSLVRPSSSKQYDCVWKLRNLRTPQTSTFQFSSKVLRHGLTREHDKTWTKVTLEGSEIT
jgi:hypothetical protein